jgi:hypothetical protein
MRRTHPICRTILPVLVAAGLGFLTGCASWPRGTGEGLIGHSQIAVMPLQNDTNDVDGPAVVQEKMAKALARRGYIIQNVEATNRILRDRFGVTLGGQAGGVDIRALGEALEADAILYGTLMDFNEVTTGLFNVRKVRAKFRLVEAASGRVLWERGLGVRSEQVMRGKEGLAATALGRLSDPRDAEAPWVTIEHVEVGKDVRESLAFGLGTRLLTKALGIHLEREADALARMIIDNLAWTPPLPPPPAPARPGPP